MFKKLKNKLNDYFFSHFALTKRQRSGFLILVALILAAELIIQQYSFYQENNQEVEFNPIEEALALKLNAETEDVSQSTSESKLENFNPNRLDQKGFINLGFSEKQANSLIKYRNSLGGNFTTVDQFKQAYVVSDWMFERLENYIVIKPYKPNLISNKYSQRQAFNSSENKSQNHYKPFYINKLSINQIIELGFSEKQAQTIINFRNSLPNQQFANAEEFHKCYAVNDYMFNKLQPYLRFEHRKEKAQPSTPTNQKMNPNEMEIDDWQALGFDHAKANNIIKYRDFIGGFKNLEDVNNCKYISSEEFEAIKNKFVFD